MHLFFYRSGKSEHGPYSMDQLISMWRRGLIHPIDEIRTDGESDWLRADKWIQRMDPSKSPPYQLMIDEQAPVEWVKKTRKYPNRTLAIVSLISAVGLLSVHWGISAAAVCVSILLWRPSWFCGTCHKPVTSKDDWCSQCGSHLHN